MSYKSHYGKGMDQADSDMVLPGSPDARRSAYTKDKYDEMSSGYGKKVSTKKNKTGTAAPNTGIQGSQERGKKNQTQDKSQSVSGTGKNHKSHYGTKMGSQLDNSVGAYDEYDYGKGRNKKGDQRKHVKAQGR